MAGWKVTISPENDENMQILLRYNDLGHNLFFTALVKDADNTYLPVCTLKRSARRKPEILANDINRHLIPKMLNYPRRSCRKRG